jgi:hypothetical protein
MRHEFFKVGDAGPRKNTLNVGTPDFDRSASVDMWFRSDSLVGNQVLFESGGEGAGMSLTLGDADGSGAANDLLFRVLGTGGQWLTAMAPIDAFSDPLTDFIHATAVFSDDNDDRFAALYVNGELADRMNGTAGAAHSLQWDVYDGAGIGKKVGALGGKSGGGTQPFDGAFVGELAALDFWNYALAQDQVVAGYELALWEASFGKNADADADGDGDSDGTDFLMWQRMLSGAFPPFSQQAGVDNRTVPEPSTMALIGLGLLLMAAVHRRGRRRRADTVRHAWTSAFLVGRGDSVSWNIS